MKIVKTAVILAGGKGTRLGEISKTVPKPMIEIGGKPLLERQLHWLKSNGIRKVILLAGHLTSVISSYFGRGENFGIEIEIIEEAQPLGTAGALGQLRDKLHEPFWVIYGDLLADIDLLGINQFHHKQNAFATLVVHPNDHPYDSDLVKVDPYYRITGFLTKPHSPDLLARNLVNAAVYLFSHDIFKYIPEGFVGDIAHHIFPRLVDLEKVMAWSTPEYLKDMGTPDRLAKVRKDFLSGKVQRMRRPHQRPTVFLDRDGVIIEYVPEINRLEDVKLRPGVGEAIRKLNQKGYLTIVVTNQPMIAKGQLSFEVLEQIHAKIETLLGADRAWLDRIYFCPHHPDQGFEGEILEYKKQCECRKPATGLLQIANQDFNIDLEKSWMVGDTWRDIECGKNFGLKTIGLMGGAGYPYPNVDSQKITPDYIKSNLHETIDFILNKNAEAK